MHLLLLSLVTGKSQFEELSPRDYEALFNDYYEAIRSYLYFKTSDEDLAEDLAQDTFMKLWDNRSKIDKKTVKSYLYTIAGNLAINQMKRQQLKYKFVNASSRQSDNQSPEFLAEMKEYEDKLNKVLSDIPEGSREVFLMNRIDDLKYREIAERLDISVKAVEKRMSKALLIIKEKLGVSI